MSGVKSSGKGLASILDAIAQLSKTEVLVGIPEGENRTDGDLSNAQLGYLMETGSPAMNLPARPHLVPAIEAVQDDISEQLTKAVDKALEGNKDRMYFHLEAAGMKAAFSVKALINSGDFVTLSQSTIKARQSRGRKSEKPLVDTAQMRNAHTYIIMKGDEEIKRA